MAFSDLAGMARRAALATFGEVVTYAPQVGAPVTPTGIFNAKYVLSQGTADAGVETLGPAVFFDISDLPGDPETDTPIITIRGVAYHVEERKPDGMGGILLPLRKVG